MPTSTQPVGSPAAPPDDGEGTVDESGSLTPATVPLPFAGSVNSGTTAFKITQNGSGRAGEFVNTKAANTSPALRATTMGGSGSAVFALNSGNGLGQALFARHTGTGEVGRFEANNSANAAGGVVIVHRGSGPGVVATQVGTGQAAFFRINNASSLARALEVTTNGKGEGVLVVSSGRGQPAIRASHQGEFGPAGWFEVSISGNPSDAFFIQNSGGGTALKVNNVGAGDMAIFERGGSENPVIRFDNSGKGFFNGGTQTGGADVAEALAVEGPVGRYRPGDVLVISTRADRRVTTTRERYSTRVAGVYATQPGVLLTERGIDEGLTGLVPVGVLGVIPTKVSAENGPIRRGDLLVTASRPGHAMRATPVVIQGVTLYPTGAILGRAMEEFRGPGTGRIRVLVNVK